MNTLNSKDVAMDSMDAAGNTITLIETARYRELKATVSKLTIQFEEAQQNSEQYPDEDYFKKALLEIDSERTERQQELNQLECDLGKLTEEFSRIPINTERLRLAQYHFEAGNFKASRAVFDAESMSKEMDALLIQKGQFANQLTDRANEFLMLAWLTDVDSENQKRFEQTKSYFEESLRAERNQDNLSAYAYFLQSHNQFADSQPLCEEALLIYRKLATINPPVYWPCMANVLGALGRVQLAGNEYTQAQDSFMEALTIQRELARIKPGRYQRAVADTLIKLGDLQSTRNDYIQAQTSYEQALAIQKELAKPDPQTYLPDVASSLSKQANFYLNNYRFAEAVVAYQDAIAIYRGLARNNPALFLLEVGVIAVDLSLCYLQDRPNKAKSIAFAKEALESIRHLDQNNEVIDRARSILETWGIDANNFIEKSMERKINKVTSTMQ